MRSPANPASPLPPHSVVSIPHYRDQQVQKHESHDEDCQDENGFIESGVLLELEVTEVKTVNMEQQVRVGDIGESSIGSGRGEEERDSQSGGHHKHHERNHVLDYFDDNAEKDTSALEEREDVEGLHTLEEAQQSQKDGLGTVLRRRGTAALSHCHSEVGEGEDEAKDVKVVPEVGEVGATSLFLLLNDLDGEVPELDEEKGDKDEGSAEEGSMEEENEQPSQEEGAIQNKESDRVLPSHLEVDLEKLGLEDSEVFCI